MLFSMADTTVLKCTSALHHHKFAEILGTDLTFRMLKILLHNLADASVHFPTHTYLLVYAALSYRRA